MTRHRLGSLGWDADWEALAASTLTSDLVPARVVEEHRGAYDVAGVVGEAAGTVRATVSGRLRHAFGTATEDALPAVGDWVLVEPRPLERAATIQHVLPRRTQFTRRGAGRSTTPQVVAANVDDVLIVTSMNRELNPRRLERYMTIAWESGARPVIVLTKADLVSDPGPAIEMVEGVGLGVPVVALSAFTGQGLDHLDAVLATGRTLALLGSSGVGKSTLANALLGSNVLAVGEIRGDDDRGRHTTSGARLVALPGGSLLIDTPGMRELGLWDADEGLAAAFEDVEAFLGACRFSDCSHEREPGCAVREALDAGTLERARWDGYVKLVREQQQASRARDVHARRIEGRRFAALTRAAAADVAAKRYGGSR